jgi:hypothetical protein
VLTAGGAVYGRGFAGAVRSHPALRGPARDQPNFLMVQLVWSGVVNVHARSFLPRRDTDTSIWYLVAALALFVALAGVFTGAVEFDLLPMGVPPFVPVLMVLGVSEQRYTASGTLAWS